MAGAGSEMSDAASPTSARGLSRRSRAVGPFPSGAPGPPPCSAPGRRGLDRSLGRGVGGTGLTSPETPVRPALPPGRMRWAFRSAPPEPRGPRGLSDSTSGPTRLGLEITRRGRPGPGPSARRSGTASLPAALPPPGSLRATAAAVRPSTHFPRDKPGGRYPAWPTQRASGEPAAGPAATVATSALPSRRPLAGRSPAPPPRLAPLAPPRARTPVCCSTYLQSLLSSHHHILT